MKPTFVYDDKLLENEDRFTDPFFKRYKLKPADQPLQLDKQIRKTYLFPTFYRDVTCSIAIFLCNYEQAEKLMPHPEIKPIKMPNNRSLVVFSSYIYNEVLGIQPYNEVAMSIPILVNPSRNPMVLPLVLENLFKNFGYYVFSMPVTSQENCIRGNEIWGLPKVVQEIDIYEEKEQVITIVKEYDGTPYLTLTLPSTGKQKKFDVTSNLYTVLNGDLLQNETSFQGDFTIQRNMRKLLSIENRSKAIKIGKSPHGDLLNQLQIEEEPLQVRFAKGMNSCFHLPNERYKAPINMG
ncbi:acetoacetate decarboxylase family protein [Bacillus carboniphilus]|uniref:Acetoacetate decarboxylase family protein n=1 Tax=Bacillus carboniphilus TaxID=86663 RepID=A0ABY9JUN2_9BACI|nr:acetoacetate decarboxylase family protein [Bacillus carboniphilus]WLR43117.1 acetoacetate decarboxylase family protein [Bacillus carboniphilus]